MFRPNLMFKYRKFVYWALINAVSRIVWHTLSLAVWGLWKAEIQPGDRWQVATCFLLVLVGSGCLVFGTKNKFIDILDKYLIRWHLQT